MINAGGDVHPCRAGPCAAQALAREPRGTVVATHRRAINLLLDDGSLVAMLPAGSSLHPWALATPFEPLLVQEGAPVQVSGKGLLAGSLRIGLEGLETVDLRLRRRPPQVPTHAVMRLVQFADRLVGEDLFDRKLTAALRTFSDGGDPRELASLVGLGAGLTPSGDDALVGALAALDVISECSPVARPLRRALVEALPVPLEPRTTRLSAQMLRAAADGLYAEPVLALLDALAPDGADPAPVERALSALTVTCADFVRACIEEGADGIFLSTSAASYEVMSANEYDKFARPGDLEVLKATKGGWFNVLHIHGQHPMFARLADYPVAAVNWPSTWTGLIARPTSCAACRRSTRVVPSSMSTSTVATCAANA